MTHQFEQQLDQPSLPPTLKLWRTRKLRHGKENTNWPAENIPLEKLEDLIGEYIYTQRLPQGKAIAEMLPERPKLMEYHGIIDRIKSAIENIVDVFEW